MASTKHLQGLCAHCQGPIEFPALSIGLTAQCPHCGQMTEMLLAPPPVDESVSRKLTGWTAAGLVVIAVGVGAPLLGLRFLRAKAAQREPARPPATLPATPATNSPPPHSPDR